MLDACVTSKVFVVTFFFIVGLAFNIKFLILNAPNVLFWDLYVYQDAISAFNAGKPAYDEFGGLRFVYPPYALLMFANAGEKLIPTLVFFFIATSSAMIILREAREILFLAILSSSIFLNQYILLSIQTGNITIYMHFAILLATLLKNQKIGQFLLLTIVLIFSMIKPYFAAYFILGFFVWPLKMEYAWRMTIFFTVFALIFLSQFLLTPELALDFLTSLQNQALGPDVKGPGIDVGKAPYAMVADHFSRPTSLAIHTFVAILMASSLYMASCYLKPFIKSKDFSRLIFFTGVTFAVVINPRMKEYDWWLFVACNTAIIFIVFDYLSLGMKRIIFAILIVISGYYLSRISFSPPRSHSFTIYGPFIASLLMLLVGRIYNQRSKFRP